MVDVQAQIDAVDRAVGTQDARGVVTRVQTLGQSYRASLADAWSAVTEADRIRRWFLPVSGDLRVGGSYQLEGNAGGVVEECAPPDAGAAHFAITWVFGGGAPSRLTVRLTDQGTEMTRLDLIFTGNADDLPEEMWEQFGPSATGIGWDQALLGLALYLDGAQDGVTPDDAATWTATDEGKLFMRLSAERWAQAHIADGADADTARSAADTTYAMYTGAAPSPME